MKPIAILFEHPDWFKPLFAELERRGLPFVKLAADQQSLDPASLEVPYSMILNRSSPSAFLRGRSHGIFYTLDWMRHWENLGVPVVNGSTCYRYEISKFSQLQILAKLGIAHPRTFAINHSAQALAAADKLRYPVLVKANIGGSGAGIVRYDSPSDLKAAVRAESLPLGLDGVALVQEYAPARGGSIIRVEVLNGKFLYAIKVFPPAGSFDLCPADACVTPGGQALVGAACATNAVKSGLKVERVEPSAELIADVLRISAAIDLDVGGVEALIDDRDGKYYIYDVNALSNFVADPLKVIGFDPFVTFVDYLEQRLQREGALT